MIDQIESYEDIAKPRRPPPVDVVFVDERHRAIGQAAERGDAAKIKAIVEASSLDPRGSVDIDGVGPFGANLLMYEIASRNEVAQRALLDAGANPNYVTPKGDSPMVAAAFTERTDELQLLLDHGGDPNLRDANGEPLIIKTVCAGRWKNIDLLLEKGADINAANASGQTPVFLLAVLNQWDQVQRFLDRGAKADVTDSTRRSLRDLVAKAYVPPESPQAAAHSRVALRLGVTRT